MQPDLFGGSTNEVVMSMPKLLHAADYVADVSKRYYETILGDPTDLKTVSKKIGQFYTPPAVGESLVRTAVCQLDKDLQSITLLDPFCGDGVLLELAVREIKKRFGRTLHAIKVTGYDIDPVAIEGAQQRLEALQSETFDLELEINLVQGDYFIERASSEVRADLCVTNPPWLMLKASRGSSSNMRSYVEILNWLYPIANGQGGFSSISANLGRVGLAASLKSLEPDAVLAIVLPSTLLSDAASVSIRKYLFSNYKIVAVSTYHAELKIFPGVDQDFCYVIAVNERNSDTELRIIRNLNGSSPVEELFDEDEVLRYFGTSFTIPDVIGKHALRLLDGLNAQPRIQDHKHIRVFREIDETRIGEKLIPTSPVRFIKGKMMGRYTVDFDQTRPIDPRHVKRYKSVEHPKIVWRDVARRSQIRRMHATLVPEGFVAGNSLGCLTVSSISEDALCYYLGFLNSWVAEFQVRALSNTNHVSTGVVQKLRFPEFNPGNACHLKLVFAVRRRIETHSLAAQNEVETSILKLLGWSQDELETIITSLNRLQVRSEVY